MPAALIGPIGIVRIEGFAETGFLEAAGKFLARNDAANGGLVRASLFTNAAHGHLDLVTFLNIYI